MDEKKKFNLNFLTESEVKRVLDSMALECVIIFYTYLIYLNGRGR